MHVRLWWLWIILSAGIVYSFCLPNAMFWDDVNFILNNQYIHNFQFWPHWFTENVIAGSNHVSNYWRPLLLAVFALEWHTFGNWVYGWHAVNALFHIIDGILLYQFIFLIARRSSSALCVALIFLLHPVQTEAVVYANSLGDSLSSFFVILSLIAYVQYRLRGHWRYLIYCAGAIILGLMSKETAFSAPFLIAALELLIFKVRRGYLALIPGFLLAAIYVILRATVLNFDNTFNLHPVENVYTQHISVRILSFFKTLATYAGLILYPAHLHVERTIVLLKSFFEWDVIVGAGLCATSFWAVIRFWNTRPLVSFGVIWFYVFLAPMSNVLIPVNAFLYEHWLYMPIVGLALVLCEFLHLDRPTIIKVLAVLFLSYALVSIYRICQWRNEEQFYLDTLQYSPHNIRLLNNLGVIYDSRNETHKAQHYFEEAIKANPYESAAYYNLGWILMDNGQTEEALTNFEKAHQLDPTYRLVYRPMLYLYFQRQDLTHARAILPKALQYFPNDPSVQQIAAQLQKSSL